MNNPAQRSAAALEAFTNLAEAWGLSGRERAAVLGVNERTPYRWGEGTQLRSATIERIGHLINIYANLHGFYDNAELADRWVFRPNAAFGNRRPIDLLTSRRVADLVLVSRYTDEAIG